MKVFKLNHIHHPKKSTKPRENSKRRKEGKNATKEKKIKNSNSKLLTSNNNFKYKLVKLKNQRQTDWTDKKLNICCVQETLDLKTCIV